ncbi:Dynein heavy chain 2, axonemal [Orchesella cincta]|uniref:Dynein heavy chain 2, axonemal n=1 Tax=Orchesella cincta TaxID=48709 RepID=A0A1D2N1D5_ORCCI|nr:Dynein heavy chain 2, axonemal [Orchesella cincta]
MKITVEIPNLFTTTEFEEIHQKLLKSYPSGFQDDPISLREFARERVERNLHLIICINPHSKYFRGYISTYGNLLKDMTVNWFEIWTRESFLEVAKHLLPTPTHINQDDPISSGSIFHSFHSIAIQISQNVLDNDLSKFAFVTPIHFIDFVEQYSQLFNTESLTTTDKIKSLKLAIQEINGVQEKIGYLTEQALTADNKAQISRGECETFSKIVEQQRADTEEQAKLVKENSGELGTEVKEFQELADVIKDEWTAALESFEESNALLQDLAEDDLTHIRSYYSPPPIVSKVLDSVMIMIDKQTTWPEAKIQLGHPDFVRNISEFDKARITQEKLAKIRKYIQNTEFTPEAVSKYSNGARILCSWIHAIEKYGRTYLTKISPKRIKLEESESSIGEKRNTLDLQTQKLQILRENLAEIQTVYETKLELKENCEVELQQANEILGRATSVLRLLEDDLLKWEKDIGTGEQSWKNLPGDAFNGLRCLSLSWPFSWEFRKELKERWLLEIQFRNKDRTVLKCCSEWDLGNFLGSHLQSLEASKSLPLSHMDSFIEDNISILKRSRRFVLAVDPYNLVPLINNDHNRDEKNHTIIEHKVKQDQASILSAYRNCIGSENSDKSPQKNIFTSCQLDPNYGTTLASRFTFLNFTLTPNELKSYFISKVASKLCLQFAILRDNSARFYLEVMHNILKFKEKIERLIISCGPTILQNVEFPDTLNELKNKILIAEDKRKETKDELLDINSQQLQFTPVAETLVMLFQSICDMSKIHCVHQISLKFYTQLMEASLEGFTLESSRRDSLEIVNLIKENMITYFFRFFLRSMFKQHRYQFALLLCTKILEANDELNVADLELMAKVSSEKCVVQDGNSEEEWLTPSQLLKLSILEKEDKFKGLLQSVRECPTAWQVWMKYFEPENKIPDVWPVELRPYDKLILLSIVRPDRLLSQIKYLTTEVLGKEHAECIEMSLIDLKQIYSETNSITPILFLIDEKGAPEPLNSVSALCSSFKPSLRFYSLSISQQNMHLARKLFEEGIEEGHWVYFSNCHSAPDYMTELGMRMEELKSNSGDEKQTIHPSFRLWLSMKGYPDTEFPLEILLHSIKIAVEQPQTLQKNMLRLYQKMPASVFQTQSANSDCYQRLLFGLSFMHSSFLGRHKFKTWNVDALRVKDDQGTIQDNDFEISTAIIKLFTSKYEKIPWWALKHMLELQYANHSSSTIEHRVVQTYLNKIISEEAVSNQDFKFSSTAPNLTMPPTGTSFWNGDLSSFHKFITSNYPITDDDPEIYGLDANVGVEMNTQQATTIFDSFQQLLMKNIKLKQQQQLVQDVEEEVQAEQQCGSQKYNSQGRAKSMMMMVDDEMDKTVNKIGFILEHLPKNVDESDIRRKICENLNPHDQPIHYVLFLELRKYNDILKTVSTSLETLTEAIQGRRVMTDEMRLIFDCIAKDVVPDQWLKAYWYTNNLACWMEDLKNRLDHIHLCASSPSLPPKVWLGGFLYPKAFLTAVLQRTARQLGKPISQLCWDFKISIETNVESDKPSDNGITVEGMYLLGAGWDEEKACLTESAPLEYSAKMPRIKFIPVEITEKIRSDTLQAPCYKDKTAIRNDSHVCWIDLNPGNDAVDNWILRNVKLLLINPKTP